MIEQYDALQRLNLPQLFATAVVYVLFGIVLEFVLRFGKRRALNRDYPWIAAVLGALTWQPLFWALLLGTVSPLLSIIRAVTGWQRNTGAVEALVLISATIVTIRLINGMMQIMTLRRPSASVSLLKNLLSGLGLMLVVAILVGYIFNISFFVILLAVVGSITGLTVLFQEPLKDLVSGVSLTLSSRLNPGDWVRLPSGLEGKVVDIQWDVTIVRQLANNIVVIANSSMTSAEIINFNHPDPVLSVVVPVGVSYSSDLTHVEQVTLEEASAIMDEINGDAPIDPPAIWYNAFADFSINFNVVLRACNYDSQFMLRHEFIRRLHLRYQAEGIVIPFPIRTLQTSMDEPLAIVHPVDGHGSNPSPTFADAPDLREDSDR